MTTLEPAFLARLSGIVDRVSGWAPPDLALLDLWTAESEASAREVVRRGYPPPGLTTGRGLPGLPLPLPVSAAVSAIRPHLGTLAADLAAEEIGRAHV